MPNRLSDVDRQALEFEQLKILGHGLPAPQLCFAIVEWGGGPAFACVDRGNALREEIQRRFGVIQHRSCGLPHHVDESRRDDQPVGVNDARRPFDGNSADPDDLAIADADVADVPRGTGPVDDPAIFHDEIKAFGGRRPRAEGDRRRHAKQQAPVAGQQLEEPPEC